MSEYNWCHNPDCHTIETQSRVRGTGDNKVLRTVRIKCGSHWRQDSIFDFFCNNTCLFQFLHKFRQEVANINPTREPKETPIKVKTEKYESYRYRYDSQKGHERVPYTATRKIIENKA